MDIHEDCRPYLGFSWGSGPNTKWYTFKVLSFGLASACYVFTKLLCPLVKQWQSMGLCRVVYIDDGICAAKSELKCIVAKDSEHSKVHARYCTEGDLAWLYP